MNRVEGGHEGTCMPAKASKIMVIRHAEKPGGAFSGVKESGEANTHDLTVRG
jgi:hypothetical protein